MEPIKPEIRQALLDRPGVTEADVNEYEFLLASMLSTDPDMMTPEQWGAYEDRFHDLLERLFINSHEEARTETNKVEQEG